MGPIWTISYLVDVKLGAALQLHILRLAGVNVVGPIWFDGPPLIVGYKQLKIGRNVAFGHNAMLICYDDIEFFDGVTVAGNFTANSASHDTLTLKPYVSPIKIGSGTWVGLNVVVCAGVTIGENVVVGAGSVVLKDIESSSVAAGVPCKFIRKMDRAGVEPFNVFNDVWGFNS
jgi:acetyltransferase-like isoleucine patch superfamily enzyme